MVGEISPFALVLGKLGRFLLPDACSTLLGGMDTFSACDHHSDGCHLSLAHPRQAEFVFENPNAKGACGCGESFNV